MNLTQADWVTLVAAAVGAFLGAAAAFVLEAIRQWRIERSDRYSSLLQAQFTISMQLNSAVNIKQQYLDEERENDQRFLHLPLFHFEPSDARVALGQLSFLAIEDRVEILQTVHVAQESFLTAIRMLETRNRYVEEIYAAGVPAGAFDFESGIGEVTLDARKARVLKGATDSLYQAVDSAIEMENRAIRELGQASKRLFRRRKIIGVEMAGPLEASS
ncbi:MAG: hypothetical protein ACYC6C_09695 [Coriobacteriia bacterium]